MDNLLTVEPHGKNPALADALKRIGLAEKTDAESIEFMKVQLYTEDRGQIFQKQQAQM